MAKQYYFCGKSELNDVRLSQNSLTDGVAGYIRASVSANRCCSYSVVLKVILMSGDSCHLRFLFINLFEGIMH